MGITEGMYPTFKRLSEKVINPAIAEINRLSDFRVTVEYQRQSRKIVALKFKIRRVVLLPEPNKGQGRLFPELDDMPYSQEIWTYPFTNSYVLTIHCSLACLPPCYRPYSLSI